jgi:molybdopterin-guanine dinucleotide biosynthesis protein
VIADCGLESRGSPIRISTLEADDALTDSQASKPKIIAIAGAASNTGKTTLLCDLLRAFSPDGACEAIKLTRGHYRSCGKDPHSCCVSHLLSEDPVIRSGREETYTFGKDTGHFWDAGAANVHWLIVTNDQVEKGIQRALERVQTRHVFIEGTSFLKFVKADFAVLVVRPDSEQLKPSARSALKHGLIDAIYLSNEGTVAQLPAHLPVYTGRDLPKLIECIRKTISRSNASRSIFLTHQNQSAC